MISVIYLKDKNHYYTRCRLSTDLFYYPGQTKVCTVEPSRGCTIIMFILTLLNYFTILAVELCS